MNGNELVYGVNDKPPLVTLAFLGLQHVILMSVYLVLVVIVVRASDLSNATAMNAVRMGMIALALTSALQALRPPFGSGFLAVPVVSAIYLKASLLAAGAGGFPLVLGMTIFAGILEMILSRFLYRLRAIFPPGISGFIITIVGIELGLEGIRQFLGVTNTGALDFEKHLFIGLLTLSIMVGLSIWWRGVLKQLCSFIGLSIGLVAAYFLGAIDPTKLAALHAAPVLDLPDPSFIAYHFSWSILVPFLVAAMAATLRTIGVITTCQKINDSSWKTPALKSIKGGVLADGMGAIIAGLCGTPGISTAPSLVGVSKATGATSRYIAFAVSLLFLLFALLPKIASLLLIIPLSVIGPALMFTASFMIVGGIEVMASHNIDTRMTYVIGFALLFGLSRELYPTFYGELPHLLRAITCTSLSLSVVIALFMHLIFRIGIQKQAVVSWVDGKSITPEKLRHFILEHGKQWNIRAELMDRIASSIAEIVQHIRAANLLHGKILLTLRYDQVDIVVQIQYEGDLLVLPLINRMKVFFLEEEAFSFGLTGFLTGVYPDKFEQSIVHDQALLKLYFSIQ